ncbi:MAG: hypothetical protein JWM93_1859 [Frankiales bacterium]|nr:hypothetical protein [Frankiales bacterium]
MATPKDKRTPAQLRAAEMRAEAARTDRRRRAIAITVGTVVALALVAAFVALGVKKKADQPVTFAAPVGAAVKTAVESAGLQVLGQEMLDFHIHAHLQVSDLGKDVTVPAGIGIETDSSGKTTGLSPLHTHDSRGIIHVESAVHADYTLGQVFKEWAVPLTDTCVGTLCSDATHDVLFYVNGEKFTGDPNMITLADKQDITVAYVDKGKSFTPERFDFAGAGL